jgi:hypothetical protein
VQDFVTESIVFNVVLLGTFLAPNPASYCFVTSMPWSSVSQVVVQILFGVPNPHLYFSATVFQTVVCGCYFNFELTEVNLVHMTDTG